MYFYYKQSADHEHIRKHITQMITDFIRRIANNLFDRSTWSYADKIDLIFSK